MQKFLLIVKMAKYLYVLLFLLLLPIKSAQAIDISGSAWETIIIKNINGVSNIYAKDYQNKEYLLYKANYVYTDKDPIGVEQYGDVLYAVISCGYAKTCDRFFNRKTDALSRIYTNDIASNVVAGKQVVAYYDKRNSKI